MTIYETSADIAAVTTANTYDVAYGLSIHIFRFDLDPF